MCSQQNVYFSTGKVSIEIENDLLDGLPADWAGAMPTAPQVLCTVLADAFVHTAAGQSSGHLN